MAHEERDRRSGDGRTLARWQRYDAVYTAAVELFVQRGYDHTTMEAIAERAGTSRASAFNYFPRKTAILVEWSRRRRAAVAQLIAAEAPSGSLRIELARYLDAWASVNEDARAETAACGPASLRETDLLTSSGMSSELSQLFAEAAQRGETVVDLDVTLAAHALAAAYFAVVQLWVNSEERPPDLRRELQKLADLFLGGTIREPTAHRAPKRGKP